MVVQVVINRFRDSGEGQGKLLFSDNPTSTEENDAFLKTIAILDGSTPVTRFILGPQQKKELVLSIPILKESTKQDHYFALVFLPEAQNEQLPIAPAQTPAHSSTRS